MRTFSFLKPQPLLLALPCFTCVMNLPEHWSKTKIGGVNLLKKPVSPSSAWALSWQRAGQHLPRCYMSLKLLNCLLAPALFSTGDGLRALVESFSRKYLIPAVTDNVVRPLDGLYGIITSAPPSVALWIIQDYVVILLILIALRFQSKYCNSKVALGSNEVLSRRHDWAAAFVSSLFFSLFSLQCLRIVNKLSNRYLLFRCRHDLFEAVKVISNHRGGKHIFASSPCQGEAKTNWARGVFTSTQSFLPPASGNFSDGIFVSGGVSCGYCSTISPPTDALPLLHTALISPRLTSRHATEPPVASSSLLSASGSYMNKTMSNFQTIPSCLCKKEKNTKVIHIVEMHNSLMWCQSTRRRLWNELKPLYLQIAMKACSVKKQQIPKGKARSGGSKPSRPISPPSLSVSLRVSKVSRTS